MLGGLQLAPRRGGNEFEPQAVSRRASPVQVFGVRGLQSVRAVPRTGSHAARFMKAGALLTPWAEMTRP